MHPEILHWGVLHITSYGLMLAIAFLVGTWLALREARRLGLDEDRLVTVILVALVAGVVGARALYVARAPAGLPRQLPERARAVAGRAHALRRHRGGHRGGAVRGAAASGCRMWVTARCAGAVAGARHGVRARGLLPERLLLRPARRGCPGAWSSRPTPSPGSSSARMPVHPVAALLLGRRAGPVPAGLGRCAAGSRVPGMLFWSVIAAAGAGAHPARPHARLRGRAPSSLRLGPLRVTESQVTSMALVLFALLMIVRLRREARPGPDPGPAAP